ncbi:MAG: hypothetical protein RIG66_25685 [Coleofasciculus sp. E2-BRE-01]
MNPASLDQQLIPALENGDRLSRAEFERRYNLMPNCNCCVLFTKRYIFPQTRRVG